MSDKTVRIVIQAGDLSEGARQAQAQIQEADKAITRAYSSARQQHQSLARSINRTAYILGMSVSFAFNFLDILGIHLPRLQEAMARNTLAYIQQLMAIAGAQMSTGNVAAAVALTTAAYALQTQVELWREENMREIADTLSKAKSSLSMMSAAMRSTYIAGGTLWK